MLKIESMTFGNFPIDGLFNPCNRIHHLIPPYFFHQVDRECILSIDGPYNKQPTIFLQFRNRNLFNILIIETIILNSHPSWRLRTRQFPWWIHHNNIKVSLTYLQLFFNQLIKVKLRNISTNRYRVLTNMWLLIYIDYNK